MAMYWKEITVMLSDIGERTLTRVCKAHNAVSGSPVTEGKATRVYARINEDGTLTSAPIPDRIRRALTEMGTLNHLGQELA